jgi:gluconokinase
MLRAAWRRFQPVTSVSARKAESPFVLVLDAGTSWLRVAIHDSRARPVSGWAARVRHPTRLTTDGGAEKDALGSLELLCGLIDRVLGKCGAAAEQIGAVGMASLASTLVGVDRELTPLSPVLIYADTRSSPEVDLLRSQLDESAVHARTGCRLHSSYLPAQLLWLSRHRLQSFARTARWLSLPDFIFARLLGRVRTSPSIASWGGLLEQATGTWDSQLLEALHLWPTRLPAVNDRPLVGLTPAYSERWPALTSVPWFPAIGDGAASNLGSGCTGEDDLALSLATSSALRVVCERPPAALPLALWRYRLRAGSSLVGGALNEGGSAFGWAATLAHPGALKRVMSSLRTRRPDGHGLTALPLLAGERSPGWNGAMRGAIVGIDLKTDPVDIIQAVMESVCYRLALVARELAALGLGNKRMVAGGGVAERNTAWLQMTADVLGRPVEVTAADPAATGVALHVLAQIGCGDRAASVPIAGHCLPDGGRHEIYQEAMHRHERLYQNLLPWWPSGTDGLSERAPAD